MKRLNKTVLALAMAGLLASGVAQAELFDRGGGLIYDNVLNVTWLSDANYAVTQYAVSGGVEGVIDGLMNWNDANTWAASLDISRFVGESLTGWRLPTALNSGGSEPSCFSFNCTGTELGHMFYNNLGASAGNSILSGTNTANIALFTNLQYNFDYHWFGTTATPIEQFVPENAAYVFRLANGNQSIFQKDIWLNAWAVRPGDVPAVPEPEAYALLMAGLGLLGVVAKRRRRFFGAS